MQSCAVSGCHCYCSIMMLSVVDLMYMLPSRTWWGMLLIQLDSVVLHDGDALEVATYNM